MRTLGIDLAAQDANTASCVIEWEPGRAVAGTPQLRRSDLDLVNDMERADWVAIDAPFGWPDAFLNAVHAWAHEGRWPESPLDRRARVKRLRYRATDLFVEARARLPLSVSTDRIAVAAMRCATLLPPWGPDGEPFDRTGGDRCVEVYPAAALVVWGLDPTGYKGVGNQQRQRLIDALQERAPWLELPATARQSCIQTDHALDALVRGLLARAAQRGATWPPPGAGSPTVMPAGVDVVEAQLRREGWIHLPRGVDSLGRLA